MNLVFFLILHRIGGGKPLTSHEVIVNPIDNKKTENGLKVACELNLNKYQKGIKISDGELSDVNIIKDDFHGEWNYSISQKIINK